MARALGVVAGGHPATAEAGVEVLRAGGNAADAAVAAVCASMTAEASLTGLGAGGFALVRRPDGRAELLDFFVAASGKGRSEPDRLARAALLPYEVPFRATTQLFNVGPASCAVPGMVPGLTTLHGRHGRLPLAEAVAPAIARAKEGATLVPQQDYLHDILEGLLTGTSGMRAIFSPLGRLLRAGDRVCVPGLAEALACFATEGAAPFTAGSYAQAIAGFMDESGGLLTAADLESYAVQIREPATAAYRAHRIITNPLPSSGGTLIAFTLALLDTVPPAGLHPDHAARTLVDAFAATEQARGSVFNLRLREPGFAEAFLGPEHVARYAHGASAHGNTTHVAVIDGDGMAVSITSSCGSGSGVVIDGTGIIMNNMMGEEDLNPGGFFTLPPGERLTSMMAPTIAWGPEAQPHDLIALGSAGSERLRSAITQVLVGMLDRDWPPRRPSMPPDSISPPRRTGSPSSWRRASRTPQPPNWRRTGTA